MTNKERFLALVSQEETDTLEKLKEGIKNRKQLRELQSAQLKKLSEAND